MDSRSDDLAGLPAHYAELSALQVNVAGSQPGDDAAVEPRCGGDQHGKLTVIIVQVFEEPGEFLSVHSRLCAHDTLPWPTGHYSDRIQFEISCIDTPLEEAAKMAKMFGYRCLRILCRTYNKEVVDLAPTDRVYSDITQALTECLDGDPVLNDCIGRKLRAAAQKFASRFCKRDRNDVVQDGKILPGVELATPPAGVPLAEEVARATASATAEPLLPEHVVARQRPSGAVVGPLPGSPREPGFSAPAHGDSIPRCEVTERSANSACTPHAALCDSGRIISPCQTRSYDSRSGGIGRRAGFKSRATALPASETGFPPRFAPFRPYQDTKYRMHTACLQPPPPAPRGRRPSFLTITTATAARITVGPQRRSVRTGQEPKGGVGDLATIGRAAVQKISAPGAPGRRLTSTLLRRHGPTSYSSGLVGRFGNNPLASSALSDSACWCSATRAQAACQSTSSRRRVSKLAACPQRAEDAARVDRSRARGLPENTRRIWT